MKLYEINEEIEKVLAEAYAQAEENDGEISEAIAEALESLEVEKNVKIGNIIKLYKSHLAHAKALKEESDTILKRSKAVGAKGESLKNWLSTIIQEGETWEDLNSKISWRKSEYLFVSAEVDLEKIPDIYKRITVVPDKIELKKLCKTGLVDEIDYLKDNPNMIKIISKRNISIK